MDIIIIEPACRVCIADHVYLRFTSANKDVIHRLSAIESIQINETTSLDAEVLREILSYNIRLSLVDDNGDTLGEWYGNVPNKSIQLKYKQMLYIRGGYGYIKASKWIMDKIFNQIALLSQLSGDVLWLKDKYESILQSYSQEQIENVYHEEPIITKHYYRQVNTILPTAFRFDKRTRMPAADPYNALINYAYSYLYRLVEDAIVSAGLDPYLGFYHSNQKGGKALVFDMIEPYRPWVDYPVIQLCLTYTADISANFTYDSDACILSRSIKQIVMTDVAAHFDRTIKYNNRSLTRKNHIYAAAKKLKIEIQNNGKS